MANDPSIDPRLIRRLGGSELAELRQRMRRHFERHGRDPEKSGFHLTKLSAVEYEALALLIGLPPRPTQSVRIDIARFDAALQDGGESLGYRLHERFHAAALKWLVFGRLALRNDGCAAQLGTSHCHINLGCI